MNDNSFLLNCTDEEIERLKRLAGSTTAGIRYIKRAKALLGVLEGISPAQLMYKVRVPVVSILKCIQDFKRLRMAYFDEPLRPPTAREAGVERMLAFLENPPPAFANDWGTLSLRYIGLNFTAKDIQVIRDMISAGPLVTCAGLAGMVCSRLQVRDGRGRPRSGTMVGILRRMEMDNLIFLPNKGPACTRNWKVPQKIVEPHEAIHGIASRQAMVLAIAMVQTREESALWNGIIHHYHYIPGYRLFGSRLRYLVYAAASQAEVKDPGARSLVAALSFSSSAWRVACRDEFIGWNDAQRTTNLSLVVNNSRFLILPWVHAPNLASRILGTVARQVVGDWESRYGCRPVLLETFVEKNRFHGTCYRAANWIEVGNTVGYSLHGKESRMNQPGRTMFLLPLHKRFREALCR